MVNWQHGSYSLPTLWTLELSAHITPTHPAPPLPFSRPTDLEGRGEVKPETTQFELNKRTKIKVGHRLTGQFRVAPLESEDLF